jgi:hypothetical protein
MSWVDTAGVVSGLALMLAAIGLRAFPGIQGRLVLRTGDRDYHMSYVELLRSTRHRIPRRDPGIVGPGELTYPYGYHWLVSFLSPSVVRWLDRFSGLLFDFVLAVTTTALLRHYTAVSTATALALSATYLILPGLTLVHHGPRAYELTPRSFSQFLVNGAFLLLVWDPDHNALLVGAVAVVLVTVALLSSKFTLQFLLFVTPVAAALARDARPLIVLACSLALAVPCSRGYFIRQLRGQLAHLRWFARHNQGLIAERRSAPILEQLKTRDFRGLVVSLVNRNVVTSAIIRHAVVIAAAVQFLIAGRDDARLPLLGGLAAAAFVPFVVTGIGRARILGGAERYLELVIPAAWASFWLNVGLDHFALSFVLVLGWCLLVYALNLWALYRGGRLATPAHMGERALLRGTLAAKAPCVVLCLDVLDSPLVIDRAGGVRVCTLHGWTSEQEVESFLSRAFLRFPDIHPDRISELTAEYGVDYVLANRANETRVAQLGRSYDLPDQDRVFTGETYELYSCARVRGRRT